MLCIPFNLLYSINYLIGSLFISFFTRKSKNFYQLAFLLQVSLTMANFSNCTTDNTNLNSDYFAPIFENKMIKYPAIITAIIFLCLNIFLNVGIIWYERYGMDALGRTLSNRMFSFLSMTIIWFLVTVIVPWIIRFGFEQPLSNLLCQYMLMGANGYGVQVIKTNTIEQ